MSKGFGKQCAKRDPQSTTIPRRKCRRWAVSHEPGPSQSDGGIEANDSRVTPARLAGATLEVLEEPERYRRLARVGRSPVLKMFDVRRTAAKALQIYQGILEGRENGRRNSCPSAI